MDIIRTKPGADETLAIGAILIGGMAERLFSAGITRVTNPFLSESHYVAISLAKTGHFADPFGYESGATAHVGMLTPLPSAIVYWLFGANNPVAEVILSCWAALLVSLTIWLCWRLACLLDVPRAARLSAVAVVALVPLQFNLEVHEGRNWEVNSAAFLLIWTLYRLCKLDLMGATKSALAGTGALIGLLFIVSPPAGLAAMPALVLLLAVRGRPRAMVDCTDFCRNCCQAFAGLWAERNLYALGEPIALRDNLGLELAIANYPGALHAPDAAFAFVSRLDAIHPIQHGNGRSAMRAAGGELAYYRKIGRQARRTGSPHIHRFSLLLLINGVLSSSFSRQDGTGLLTITPVNFDGLRQLLTWIFAIGGLATATAMAFQRRAYAYILIATCLCALPYAAVQPTLRYRYLISTLLIFLMFDGVGRVAARFRGYPT